uniref:Uncharacterized protein n=1 Tax=Branchiostoma floridae TaxID=7739 RepID=C3Z1J4_BRAFL|eukprot:XP_002597600.1 hypothetical protein BRAFLDRAFT_123123 [Branchiostoma floridae]
MSTKTEFTESKQLVKQDMDDFGCHDDDDVIFSWLIPDEEDWIDGGRGGEVNGNSHGSVGNTLVSILSQHLVSHRELVRAGRVLEVGAGVGLPGLVAAALSENPSGVVMTDYVEDAVDLMDMNIAETFGEDNNRPQAAIMDWDDDPSVLQEHHGTFDVIIGSDVVYWPVLIQPLIRTVKALLSNKPTSRFLMLYSRRNPIADKLLFQTALKYRLDSRELSLEQNTVHHAVLNHPVYREDTDMFHLYEFRHSNES